ncbi:MAG: hypothetical protein ABIQ86_13305 [Steroidobacteraceae bacterium]
MKKCILVTLALIAVPAFTFSAEVLTPQAIANRFFEYFLKDGNVEAIDYFMGLNPKLKANAAQVQKMKDQLAGAVRVYGKPLAVESVSVEDLTPSLQRRVYITKHSNRPLVWEMYFYKSVGEWMPD